MTSATAISKGELDNQYTFKTTVQSQYLGDENITDIFSDYVIFATGGFSASRSKLNQ